jgi:hypothetical protein
VTEGAGPPGIDEKEKRIRFDYIKSQFFRVIHVDGIFGGTSPIGKAIRMSVWNERWPIPKQTVHEMDELGNLLKEVVEERIQRDAIVREVEVDLVMDVDCAKQMREWLSRKIEQYDEIMKLQSKTGVKTHKKGGTQ